MDAKLARRDWLALAAGLGCAPGLMRPARAQTDLSRPVGPTVADTGSPSYRFERWTLPSAEPGRPHRVTLGVPRRPAPPAGHPAAWLLDGNAALAALDEPLLRALDDGGQPPVLVAIGPDSDLGFDGLGRAYDYTPPDPQGGEVRDPQGRLGGGADRFLELIAEGIRPEVEARTRLAAGGQAIWGQSYAGLLVLHALFTRPALFSHYVAAAPALWWRDGLLLAREPAAIALPRGEARQLLVVSGDGERERGGDPQRKPDRGRDGAPRPSTADEDVVARMQRARAAVPPTALADLVARRSRRPGLHTQWIRLPGLDHGPLLPASVRLALRGIAGLAPQAR